MIIIKSYKRVPEIRFDGISNKQVLPFLWYILPALLIGYADEIVAGLTNVHVFQARTMTSPDAITPEVEEGPENPEPPVNVE